MASAFDTHQVTNQPPPLADYDVFAADAVLVGRHGAGRCRGPAR